MISASGRDIVFQTSRGLVPDDTDGVGDIYDARVEGGFHPDPPPPCTSPEACGEGNHQAARRHPSSAPTSFVGPGNAATQLECAKGRHRVNKHGKVVCVPNKPRKHRRHKRHKRAHREVEVSIANPPPAATRHLDRANLNKVNSPTPAAG